MHASANERLRLANDWIAREVRHAAEARLADEVGFHAVWLAEHHFSSYGICPSLGVLAAAVARETRRVRIGTGVVIAPFAHPIRIAEEFGMVDILSGGRLDFGLGRGYQPKEFRGLGVSMEKTRERFDEALEVIRRAWTEDVVSFEGEFYRVPGLRVAPKPLQKPHPPLWFGGHHPNALRRAVELGQGFVGAGSVGTATFVEEVRVLRGILRDAGRDPARFPVGKRVYIAVDADRARAGRRLAEWFGAFYGRPELAAEVAVWGEPAECVDRLREIVAGGAGMLMLNPVFDELAQLEQLASRVAPKL